MREVPGHRELLTAEEVAQLLDLRSTTIYQWCRQGRLPCLKLGKEWRIRRSALETFLEQSERRPTLIAQLRAFLTVPDHVIGIAENEALLHRLDSAFFRVGESQGGILLKFTGGESVPLERLRADLEKDGLAVRQLEAAGRMRLIPERDPRAGRVDGLRAVIAAATEEGRSIWVSFNWTEQVSLETLLQQHEAMAGFVTSQRQLIVKTALLETITDEWPPAMQRNAQNAVSGTIWLSQRGLALRRAVPLPPD